MAYKKWCDMNADEQAEAKAAREERLAKTQELLVKGIQSVIDSGQWQKFLEFSSRFHQYSFRNMMLVWMQRPNSTCIASVKKWNELHRWVKKGEHGMEILVPIFKKEMIEGKEMEMLVGFKVGHVFDISQTDGADLPEEVMPSLLRGNNVELLHALIRYGMDVMKVRVEEEIMDDGANGYITYSQGKPDRIAIKASNEPTMKAKTMAHELAHGILHSESEYAEHTPRDTKELEAESTAFLVMNTFGIDSGEYSFLYLASWGGGAEGIKQIQESGGRIHRAANAIISWVQEQYGYEEAHDEAHESVSGVPESSPESTESVRQAVPEVL